ncbi:hypothetical protein GH714_036423 [Hevea brasiliensis]|uniref:Pentacotripeptide-repeat region of PRORP domain-containing protein n=1 Tax=Hevea brasiliensis TaxID=3981 RepID=A0A6A6LM03_HEVBR|nr:hypothetical protein GH714_036423 [Hevea brasiliensis]
MYRVRTLNLYRGPFEQINLTHLSHNIANPIGFSYSRIESNRLLDDLSKRGRIDEARHMFDKMPCRDKFAWNTMIAAYANSGRLTEANLLFHETPLKSSITWSSLISGYCKYGCEIEAFELYWQMQFEGQKPNTYTLGSVIRLCSTMGFRQRGEQIHGYAIKTRLDGDVFVVTGLVDMYAKCESILEAEYLFEIVADSKNHATWTAMLTGYSRNGDGFKAIECFRDMRTEGVESNQFTFPSILTACGAISARDFGVQRVLENMEINDVISWNAMIVGFVREGFEEEALSLFHEMHARNMKINDYTYPSVLNCFVSVKDIQKAKSVHCLIVKTGFGAYKLVNNALVDMYAKQGKLDYAFMVFDQMPDKDVISWTSLVTGYSYNGSYEDAIKLFCDMRIAGVCPDQIALASVLSACAELTVMEFGQQVHATIIRSGLESSLSVDNSLLTMYAKCGGIEDANHVFDSMETRNVISWTALIVGYAKNGRGKDSLQFYDQMTATGTKPDFITFIGLLFACSHTGLVEEGRQYFGSMDNVYGIKPGPEHYACMIDLLGRSGKLAEAKELLNQML